MFKYETTFRRQNILKYDSSTRVYNYLYIYLQTNLIGRALRDYLHPNDYAEYVKLSRLINSSDEVDDLTGRMCTLRMKSVISPRGRILKLKTAMLKVTKSI